MKIDAQAAGDGALRPPRESEGCADTSARHIRRPCVKINRRRPRRHPQHAGALARRRPLQAEGGRRHDLRLSPALALGFGFGLRLGLRSATWRSAITAKRSSVGTRPTRCCIRWRFRASSLRSAVRRFASRAISSRRSSIWERRDERAKPNPWTAWAASCA